MFGDELAEPVDSVRWEPEVASSGGESSSASSASSIDPRYGIVWRPLTMRVQSDGWKEHAVDDERSETFVFAQARELPQSRAKLQLILTSESESPLTLPSLEERREVARVSREFVVLASSLPAPYREDIGISFSRFLDTLELDEPVPRMNIDSLRNALRFLSHAGPAKAPSFSVTERGEFYLQWYDGHGNIAGIAFRPNGDAIWSAVQGGTTGGVTAESGTRPWKRLPAVMRALCPWIFTSADPHELRRRAAS